MKPHEKKEVSRVIPIADEKQYEIEAFLLSCNEKKINECIGLFTQRKMELLAYFEKTQNLVNIYKKLTTSRWVALLDVLHPHFIELCNTSEDFINIISVCSANAKYMDAFLEQATGRLPNLAKAPEDFSRILPCFQPDQIVKAYSLIKPQLLELAEKDQASFIKQYSQVSEKLLKEEIEPQLSNFIKIYNALSAGETHFFSSSSERKSLQLLMDKAKNTLDKFAVFHKYAQDNPKSRAAEALRLVKLDLSEEQLKLEIYKSAFKRSAWYARSCVTGCSLFSSAKVAAITKIDAARADMRGTRYWKICQSLKPKPKPAAPAPGEAKFEAAPTASTKPTFKPNKRR